MTRELLMFGEEIAVEDEPNNFYVTREALKDTCLQKYARLRQDRKKY